MNRIEIDYAGKNLEVNINEIIEALDNGCVFESYYLSKIIQELVAKCEALGPLNHNMPYTPKIVNKQKKEIERLEAELKQLKEEKEKSNTHGIDWELFATGEIAVQCETEGDATEFLKEAINRGYSLDCSSLSWRLHESDTCFRNKYVNDHCSILFCGKDYYESKGIKVVKWKPDEKEVLYDDLEDVQVKSAERIKKLVSKIKEQKETIEFYKNQCEELRQSCNDLREENESIKNDKSELILAIKNTRDDTKMTIDYLEAIINRFSGSDKFDWKKFKSGSIAVHCSTIKEAKDFINKSKQYIKTWRDGDKIDEERTYWEIHENETCYAYNNIGLMISSRETSHNCGREILEWSDYMVGRNE